MVVGLLVIGSVLLRPRPAKLQSPAGSEPPTKAARVAPADTAPVAAAPMVAATRAPSIAPPVATGTNHPTAAMLVSAGGGGSATLLRVKGGAVLATVNGTAIELKDLLPLPPEKEGTEHIVSAERYAFLLDRAVDREITLQNARAQHMDLTESQREQLAKLRARNELPRKMSMRICNTTPPMRSSKRAMPPSRKRRSIINNTKPSTALSLRILPDDKRRGRVSTRTSA